MRTLIFQPHSELEGWLRQPDGRGVFVTSSPKNSIYTGRSEPVPSFSTRAGTRGVLIVGWAFERSVVLHTTCEE